MAREKTMNTTTTISPTDMRGRYPGAREAETATSMKQHNNPSNVVTLTTFWHSRQMNFAGKSSARTCDQCHSQPSKAG